MPFAAHVHQLPAPVRHQLISAPGQYGFQSPPGLTGLSGKGKTVFAAVINLAQHVVCAGQESVDLSRQSIHDSGLDAMRSKAVANLGILPLRDQHILGREIPTEACSSHIP